MTKKLDAQMITIIALVASAVLVAAGGYLMLVSPQQSKATKVATEIDTAQTELVVAQGASARPVPFNAWTSSGSQTPCPVRPTCRASCSGSVISPPGARSS